MNKKFYVFLSLVFLNGFAFGQQVQLGKEADNPSFTHIPVIIKADNDKMYVLRISKINPQGYKLIMGNEKAGLSLFLLGYGRANSDDAIMNLDNYYGKGYGYALEVYDGQMNLQKSYPFDVVLEKSGILSSTGNKAIFPKKVVYLNNKITFFSTLYDAKQKTITAGYHFLSEEGVLDKKINPLTEIAVTGDDLEKRISFVLSPDQSKVLLYYPVKTDSRNPQPKVYIKLVNTADFSTLMENEFPLADKDAGPDIESVVVNNSGMVFVLSKNDLKGQEKDKSAQKYKYVLYSCNKDSKSLEEFNMKIGDQFYVNNVLLKVDSQDNILASGFYSEKSANYAKGAYVISIDGTTRELKLNTLAPFSAAVSGEEKEDADKEKAFYHMRDIRFLSDGSIVLFGEQYFIDISRSNNYGYYSGIGGSTTFTYRYKNMLVMNLKPSGEIKWMKDIAKKQVTSDDGAMYSSFVPMVINDKISIMVNGHKDGLEKRMSAFTDNNMVYQLEFDSSGNMTKKALYSGSQAETRLCPKVSYKISDQQVILYNVRHTGSYRFAKLTF